MPFGWAARPLFRPTGELDESAGDMGTIYRQETNRQSDDDLFKLLNDFRRPDKMNRLTTIPGGLNIVVKPFKGNMPSNLI